MLADLWSALGSFYPDKWGPEKPSFVLQEGNYLIPLLTQGYFCPLRAAVGEPVPNAGARCSMAAVQMLSTEAGHFTRGEAKEAGGFLAKQLSSRI